MNAALDDASPIENQDLVSLPNRRQPVRDDERRPSGHHVAQRLLDQCLGFRIEMRGRLVEDQQARVLEDRARDRKALLLAAGESIPRSPAIVA